MVIGDILQPTHLLFVLVIALLVLGPKRLPEVGRSLGKGLKDFRSALSGEEHEHHEEIVAPASAATPAPPPPTSAAVTPAPPPVHTEPQPVVAQTEPVVAQPEQPEPAEHAS